jgi:nucleoid-associated protein YgaU
VRRLPGSGLARSLALTALGVSLAAAVPAAADGRQDARRAAPAGHPATSLGTAASRDPAAALAGLPLPDRVATSAPARPRGTGPAGYRVVAGDTLWTIAAAALPPGATEAEVDRAWRRIAAANAGVVADPDLIFPGTALRVPPLDDPLGKDQP